MNGLILTKLEAEKLRSYYETKLQEVEKLLYDTRVLNQEQIAKAENEYRQFLIEQKEAEK